MAQGAEFSADLIGTLCSGRVGQRRNWRDLGVRVSARVWRERDQDGPPHSRDEMNVQKFHLRIQIRRSVSTMSTRLLPVVYSQSIRYLTYARSDANSPCRRFRIRPVQGSLEAIGNCLRMKRIGEGSGMPLRSIPDPPNPWNTTPSARKLVAVAAPTTAVGPALPARCGVHPRLWRLPIRPRSRQRRCT